MQSGTFLYLLYAKWDLALSIVCKVGPCSIFCPCSIYSLYAQWNLALLYGMYALLPCSIYCMQSGTLPYLLCAQWDLALSIVLALSIHCIALSYALCAILLNLWYAKWDLALSIVCKVGPCSIYCMHSGTCIISTVGFCSMYCVHSGTLPYVLYAQWDLTLCIVCTVGPVL